MARFRFLLLVGLAICCSAAFAAPQGKPIASQGEINLSLQDARGEATRLEDFGGRVVAVVFGYTHCPDYCPTTLARLAGAVHLLGSPADLVPVFVTLDPKRDTADVLGAYVGAFHPALVGLRGDAAQTAETARGFRVLFEKVQEPDGGYSVDHSGGIFLVDRQGRLRLKEPDNLDARAVAEDIRWLLQEK